jgi:hypothetical protein
MQYRKAKIPKYYRGIKEVTCYFPSNTTTKGKVYKVLNIFSYYHMGTIHTYITIKNDMDWTIKTNILNFTYCNG